MNQQLRQSRGDSVTHSIPLVWNGSAYTVPAGVNLLFTAKSLLTDADASAKFQKTSGAGITASTGATSASVEVVHVDTKSLTEKVLFWDIQAQESGGAIKTVAQGTLALDQDVTRNTSTSVTVYTTNPPAPCVVSDATPQPLSVASAGTDTEAARADHVHAVPDAASVPWADGTGNSVGAQLTELTEGMTGKLEVLYPTGNTTAGTQTFHIITSSLTLTDPTPSAGAFFEVFIRNGTATVGGVAYSTAGTRLMRIYHSGSWTTYRYLPS